MSTVSQAMKQVARQVLASAGESALSSFRRRLLEFRIGDRQFISDGRESARIAAVQAGRETEAQLEAEVHARRNAEQLRLTQEEIARKQLAETAALAKQANAPGPESSNDSGGG